MKSYSGGTVETMNNAIIWLYALVGFLILIMICAIISAFYPQFFVKMKKWLKKLFGIEKNVKTVYSDKSRNYSETEFLPVPVKAPTETFSYEFLGWNKFAKDKKGNIVIEPIYLKKVKTCIVVVYDEKDNVLETHEVQYGAGINIAHKLVLKAATNEFEYEFVGWDKETKAFFENTEIRPVFKAKPIKFNYKFVMDDGKTIVFEKNAISGTPIIAPTAPAKVDEKFIYEFVEWKDYKRNMVLDKNYIFEAVFEKKLAKTEEEKLTKQKNAIEVVLNDYKPKKNKVNNEKYGLQDNQKYTGSKKIEIEKNKMSQSLTSKNEQKEELKANSLLKGVIVEKNKTNKIKK